MSKTKTRPSANRVNADVYIGHLKEWLSTKEVIAFLNGEISVTFVVAPVPGEIKAWTKAYILGEYK